MDWILTRLWNDLCHRRFRLSLSGPQSTGESYLWACLQVTQIKEGVVGTTDLRHVSVTLQRLFHTLPKWRQGNSSLPDYTAPVRITLLSWEACWTLKKWQHTSWMSRCGAGRRPHCVWLYHASWGIMSDNGEEWEALYLNSLTLSTMWACSHNIPYNVSIGGGYLVFHYQIKARVNKNNRRYVAWLAWDDQVSCGVVKQPLVFQTSRCHPFMWSYLFPFRIPCQANQHDQSWSNTPVTLCSLFIHFKGSDSAHRDVVVLPVLYSVIIITHQ